jgi:putative DNA primase/helicase
MTAMPAHSDVSDLALLMAVASGMTPTSDAKAVEALLQDLMRARLDPLAERRVLEAVKHRTRVSLAVLGEALRQLRGTAKRDTMTRGAGGAWIGQMILSDTGEPKAILANAITALRHAPEWQGVLAFDEFHGRTVLREPPPWDGSADETEWTEAHDLLATEWLQRAGIHAQPETVAQAVEVVARERPLHPVRDYLDRLAWDGTPRLDSWLIDHLGVADFPYARAVGARWMIGAVARVFRPGCKADCALILEGEQGIRKSTALRTMSSPWFTDELADLGSRDAALQTRDAWVIELAELDAVTRAEVSRIKAFMSRSTSASVRPTASA